MSPKFTLRTLLVVIAAIAVGIAILLSPTPWVAKAVFNGTLIAIVGAACLAAGLRQPARSFWLGFALACSGFLVLDGLSQRRLIPHMVFTRTLVAMVDNWLPPIIHRGQPGTTRYFRNDGQFPVYYYEFDEDGMRKCHGQMTMDQAQSQGAFDGGLALEDLPHIDNVPTNYARSQMLPYWLAGIFGATGGLLSYVVCYRTMS